MLHDTCTCMYVAIHVHCFDPQCSLSADQAVMSDFVAVKVVLALIQNRSECSDKLSNYTPFEITTYIVASQLILSKS